MPIYVPGKMRFHQPQYPTSPAPQDGNTWIDPVTGMTWTYQSSTSTWVDPVEFPPEPTDPDFASVSLLLHMDGSDGSTTFTDSSSNGLAVTAYGGAQLTTADKKYGTAAGTFDGSDDYIQTATSSELVLGTGDFTIEMWLKPDTISHNDGVFTFGTVGPSLSLYLGNWWLSNSDAGGNNMGAASASSWQHVAITRSSTSVRFFINGTQLGSTLTWTKDFTHNQIDIGRYAVSFAPTYLYDGLMDDFRITKGVARYTANFTPSTAPFPDS